LYSKFQHHYGYLRDEVPKTLKEYLNGGILAHGATRVYCDGCNTRSLSPSPASAEACAPPVVDPAIAFGEGGWCKESGEVRRAYPQ